MNILIHLINGDIISTTMFSEIKSVSKRMICIQEAIGNGNLICGVHTTSNGGIRKAQMLIPPDKVVIISANMSNGRENK